jgi:hypothetical protein
MKNELEHLKVDAMVPWEGSLQPMSMIMVAIMKAKPTYSLKP